MNPYLLTLDPVKGKKTAEALEESSGIKFEPATADRLFGVHGEAPKPINFGKYAKFFQERGNTVGGKRSIAQKGNHYNKKAYKDLIHPYLKTLNPGTEFNYAVGGQTDPPGLMQEMVTGMGYDIEQGIKFNGWLETLAEAESFSGKRQSSDTTSAKGLYHFTDDSVVTARNRLKNLGKKHNFDKKLMSKLKKEVDAFSPDGQAILTLANLAESPDAPLNDWMKGEVPDESLYYMGHHTDAKDAISSKDKVYENWVNATKRVESMRKKDPSVNKQYFMGGLLDGADIGSLLGGPIGMANIGAGLLNTTINSFIKPAEYNAEGSSMADFNLSAKHTRGQGQNVDKMNAGFDAVSQGLEGIPMVGSLAAAPVNLIKGVANLIGGGKSSKKEVFNEYIASAARPETMSNRKMIASNAFAELGGTYGANGLIPLELKDSGLYEVGIGGTHAENPVGGVSFNRNAQGGMDQAEEHEMILDGPGGKKLVFSNKF